MTGGSREPLFDLVHESIFARGLDGRIRSWNPASVALYGWSVEQAVGQDVAALLGAEPSDTPDDVMAQLLETGRWDGELSRRAACGAERHVEARWSLRRDEDGAPIEIIELGRDISRRRAAEAALRKSERRYSSLFQAMAAAFWELDFSPVGEMLRTLKHEGVTDFAAYFEANPAFVRRMMGQTRVVDVNETTLQMFGAVDRSVLHPSVEPYWPEGSSHVFAAAVLAAIGGKPYLKTETRLRRQDGTDFDALFTASFPDESVARGTLLVGVVDISGRVQAQAALNRFQAEFAHAARVSMLGELTASIAHEVNQPLAAIATNAAAGLRWLGRAEPNVDQALRLTQRIVEDAQRAGDIIARIREMATDRRRPPEPVSINALIQEGALFLKHELQAQGVKLVLVLDPDLPSLAADRTQLQQVLVNLAVNAVQAMTGAGSETRELHIRSGRVDPDRVSIAIRDTGPGLPPDQMDRLFRSFFTTRADGMGMGLAICRSIIEAHGGEISAANADGGGAIFTVTLPVPPET